MDKYLEAVERSVPFVNKLHNTLNFNAVVFLKL